MVKANKEIFLLLAGGTWLFDKNQRFLSVQEAEDVPAWLATMPELSIMADLRPIFISPEEEVLGVNTWQRLAKSIGEQEEEADGFLVISRTEQLAYTAAALSFLLPNFSKNIILTASQISGSSGVSKKEIISNLKNKHSGSGLRANLINALQALSSPLPGVGVMFGTRLIPGLKLVSDPKSDLNIFASVDDYYWGRVDFGVNVKANLAKQTVRLPKFSKLHDKLLIIEDLPGLTWSWPDEIINKQGAVLVRADQSGTLTEDKIERMQSWSVPVVVYQSQERSIGSGIVAISGCTWPVAVIKTMWAAANAKDKSEFIKMMKKNYLGEYFA